MEVREYPVLDDGDRPLIDALAVGLGDDTATVLTYLLRRTQTQTLEPPATRPEIRIGTGLGRDTTITATNHLLDAGLVTTHQVTDNIQNRSRKAWAAAHPRPDTEPIVYRRHADALLAQADTVATDLNPDTDHPHTNDQPPTTDIAIALNWEPNPLHFPFLVADTTDRFTDYGTTTTLHPNRGSGEAMAQLLDGDADLAIVGPATLARHLATGTDVVPIALPYQRSMVVLYSTRTIFANPFDSIDQLRGKRIAMTPDTETSLIAKLFLTQANVYDDVDIIPTTAEERDTLLAGEADVAVGVFTDTLNLEADGHTVDELLVGETYPIPGPAIVTTPTTLQTNRDAVTNVLAATMSGWAAGIQDITTIETALQTTDDTLSQTVTRLVEEFGTSPRVTTHGWGWHTTDQWRRLPTALEQADLLYGDT